MDDNEKPKPMGQVVQIDEACIRVGPTSMNAAKVANSPPQLMPLPIGLHEDLVDVPFPF